MDEYLELRGAAMSNSMVAPKIKRSSSAAEDRQLKKDKARLERQIQKAETRISELEVEQDAEAFNQERLEEVSQELNTLRIEKNRLEEEWLQITLTLEE